MPQGDGISAQGERLTEPLKEIMKENCFGREKSGIPDIKTAMLENDAGMIGAAGLILITNNTREFLRVRNLEVKGRTIE